MTARDVFGAAGIQVEEAHRSPDEALRALARGDVAGVVMLSGKPVPALTTLTSAEAQLLAIPASAFPDGYLPSRITHDDYPNLVGSDESVATPALGSVLFAYRRPPGKPRYAAMEAFVIAMFSRLADLQASPRHPKWREVNLAAATPGWDRFAPAEHWLKRRTPVTQAALRQDFERYLARSGLNPASSGERNRLFEDFIRTRNRTFR